MNEPLGDLFKKVAAGLQFDDKQMASRFTLEMDSVPAGGCTWRLRRTRTKRIYGEISMQPRDSGLGFDVRSTYYPEGELRTTKS
jgi:hypothetical protein